MSFGRTEALALLGAWFSARALLRCDLSFVRAAACSRVRFVEPPSDTSLHFFSDDTFTELVIPLSEDVTFVYGTHATGAPDDAATYGRTLDLIFPLADRPADPDYIRLTEVIEELVD